MKWISFDTEKVVPFETYYVKSKNGLIKSSGYFTPDFDWIWHSKIAGYADVNIKDCLFLDESDALPSPPNDIK